jgi:hypothetical protein
MQNACLALPMLAERRLVGEKVRAFVRAWHYLSRAKIRGDYLEFGVYQGMSFALSMQVAARFFKRGSPEAPRFFAFDSFAGLPAPDPLHDADVFKQREYTEGIDVFRRNVRRAARGWHVGVVPGFYERSLSAKAREEHGLKTAAFVNVDCDLYQSTLAALRFAGPALDTGSILYFDDWYYSGGDMRLGEAGACAAWLRENPGLELVDFGNVAIMGKMFLVNRAPGGREGRSR